MTTTKLIENHKLSAPAHNPEDEGLLVYNAQLSNRITVLDFGHVAISGDESCDLHLSLNDS